LQDGIYEGRLAVDEIFRFISADIMVSGFPASIGASASNTIGNGNSKLIGVPMALRSDAKATLNGNSRFR
jgi:hypothetical protein